MDPTFNMDSNERPRLQSLMSGSSQPPADVNTVNQQEYYQQLDARFGSMNFLLPEAQNMTQQPQQQPDQGFQI